MSKQLALAAIASTVAMAAFTLQFAPATQQRGAEAFAPAPAHATKVTANFTR